MEKILKVGDVIEVEGKRYKTVPEVMEKTCKNCAFRSNSLCHAESSNCFTGGFIFEEVKEPPRHIELGVVKVEGDKVTFKIIEQTHKRKEFCQQIDRNIFTASSNIFRASNKIKLGSKNIPEWIGNSSLLFCRGFFSDKDNIEIVCTTSEFALISEAINEYNSTDGKGYEKPWPQKGDEFFYILDNGAISSRIFDDDKYDCDMQDYGNLFRTEEEAIEARDKVKVLLNGL